MRRLISLLCLLSFITILPVRTTVAEDGVLDLFVTNTDEIPQAGAILSPKGAGSQSAPTDQTGRTRIKLPRGAKPGKWVTLQLIKGPGGALGWYLMSPWKGRTVLPEMNEDPDNYLTVVIAKNRDKKVLNSARAMSSAAVGVLLSEASMTVTANATAEQRQLALEAQANLMGLETSEIDQSIRTSLAAAKDSYERGLLALYNKTYPAAIADLSKFLQESPKKSVKTASAEFFLGQAYQATGDYKKAIEAYRVNTASDVMSLSALGLAYKLAGDEPNADAAFSSALVSDSTEAMSKVQLMTNLRRIYDPQKQGDKLLRFYATAESTLEQEFYNLTMPSPPFGEMLAQGFNKEYQLQYLADLSDGLKRTSDRGDKVGQAQYLSDMGSVYLWSKDYKKALESYQSAERLAGDKINYPAQVKTILGMATIYQDQQQHDKAIEYFLKALPLIQKLDNPQLENFALQRTGESYVELKKPDEAKKYFEQVAAAIQSNFGPDEPSLANPLEGLARVYFEQGKYAEAQKGLIEVLSIREKALGANSPYVLSSLLNLAELARYQKMYDEATRLYQQSLIIAENTTLPAQREYVNYVVLRLAGVYEEQNKLQEAKALYEKSLSLDNRQLPDTAIRLAKLAKIYLKEQKPSEALNLYQQAFEIIAKSDSQRSDLTDVLSDYARLLRATNREPEALKVENKIRERSGPAARP